MNNFASKLYIVFRILFVILLIVTFAIGVKGLHHYDVSKLDFETVTVEDSINVKGELFKLDSPKDSGYQYYATKTQSFKVANDDTVMINLLQLYEPVTPTILNGMFRTNYFISFWSLLIVAIIAYAGSWFLKFYFGISDLFEFCDRVKLVLGDPILRVSAQTNQGVVTSPPIDLWGDPISMEDFVDDDGNPIIPPNPFDEQASTITTAKKDTGVKLSDIHGIDEVKNEVIRILDILKNKDAYLKAGARLPKGLVLYGPPGTGKTMIAKAMANESGANFYFMNGSEFIEKYVGVGAQRVRELYAEARKNAPSLVFIDEIDSIACRRDDDRNAEYMQTLNALLSELDSVKENVDVFTVVTTNRFDKLDPAFLREGRFDLKLAVTLPDLDGRLALLKHYGANKRFYSTFSYESLAKMLVGFSGAQIETLLNEAALACCYRKDTVISKEDIHEAIFKIIMNGNKKEVRVKGKFYEANRELTAYHEAGHTIVSKMFLDEEVPFVTIVPSTSGAAGVTFTSPIEDVIPSKKQLQGRLMVDYAGRAAEELLKGDKEEITAGASADIAAASKLIKRYLDEYGLGDALVNSTELNSKHDIYKQADALAQKIYGDTIKYLKENWSYVEAIAKELLVKDCLFSDDIVSLIQNVNTNKEVSYA